MLFVDRFDAGRRLAERLRPLTSQDVVVVGLPRGGVPVAFEVATALHAPLDVIVVRKLGVPFQPELGMGAVGEGGVRVINDEVVRAGPVSAAGNSPRSRAGAGRAAAARAAFRGGRAARPARRADSRRRR